MSVEGFGSDDLVQDAVIHNFAVIGEAVRHVPVEVQSRYSEIPWNRMRGMRNLLIHDYSNVDHRILWETLRNDLPSLARKLRDLLEEEA